MEQLKIDYIGKYITIKFNYSPSLNMVMEEAPAAQHNHNKNRWEMPPNDLTVKWIKDFNNYYPNIEMIKSKRLEDFINTRIGNIEVTVECRASINTPLKKVDDASYKLKPYKHQFQALRFLAKRQEIEKPFAALFYEMGLGKTKIVIDFSEIIKAKKVMVILPKTLCYSWEKEIKANLNMKNVVIIDATKGTSKSRVKHIKAKLDNRKLDRYRKFVLINYESVINPLIFKTLTDYDWDILTLDESTYIKNYRAKRTKAIIKLREVGGFRILMTGTPITNSYLDLFAPMQFLSPEILGIPTLTAYRATYAIMGGFKQKQVVGWRNVDDLMDKIKRHSLIATLDDCLDIPEARPPIVRSVDLKDKKYDKITKAYNSMRDKFIVEFRDENITAQNVLTKCLRLQQITSGFITNEKKETIVIDTPPKIKPLLEVINELGDKEKVIIGARFRYDIQKIKEALKPYGKMVEISGAVTGKARDIAISEFEKNDDIRFLIGTPKTFGYGLTFVKTKYVIMYSSSFSYEVRKQTFARIRRPGQKRSPVYIDIICKHSVDQLILTALHRKASLLSYVMENGGNIEDLLPEL
jgi:SNF2 family DNA or RNA helicase